ncbi:coiled-coil domain-containing protein 40 [Triplophysa dalaica]|uniref:coiled-coil domain-containing protein 40 n=1 Tax=Triplophysa dalaica TaxID=1582913 RepID=UPI0024E008C9|nr:coiled-coil domain-containing protein 40 [Triplophysa dalaica]XP_056606299.1 coiled-coil domain-containing protein 40 [Triplophysa dalaica]XP_056606300.1 coiled-coil domain-containing protein 40 [Triplophysa dalaica]
MDGGRNGGLLEDQMNRQDETLGQNTEVTEPERDGNSMELSDSDVGGNDYSGTSEPVLLLNSETDNKRTPVLPQYSFELELSSSGAQWRGREEEENEEQEELLVLDPEHPLMKRFQSALKKHLSNQLERQILELREKKVLEKAEVQRRQELAEEVYMVQEVLAKLQASLEASHEANGQTSAQRRQAQDELDTVKNQYHATASHAQKQRTQVSELQSKVDSMATILLYMQKANTDLRLDIKAIINASNKAQRERTQAEEHKYQQDVYVERLTKQVEKLSGQIALFELQITAQSEETKAAKETYSEAQLELDSLNVEHKQLFQQWNSSLVMMRKRDEAYNAMQEELRQINDQMLSLETKIDGYKKSITQEEEQNERLTLHLNQAQADCTTSHKLLTHSQNHQEGLQAQYSNYTQIQQETEKTLSTLHVEREVYQSKLKAFRNQMEKESAVCLNLQDQIMNKLKEQFTHNNSAKYSCRLTDKTASQRREKEAKLTKLENGINVVKLESQMLVTHLNSLAPLHAELEKEMSQQRQLLSSREAEISGNVTDIERKQSMINIFNKKIKEIVSSTGHEDLSPLEICAATLSKELEEVVTEIKEQQHLWLWQQGELVRFTQEKQAHSCSVQTLCTQLTILQQSQINRKSEMEQDQREQADLENQIKDVMADMIKLNCLLSKNSDLNQTLQQNNSLIETEFRQRLKEAKSESVETQLKLEMLNKEKERLVNSLVEAERLIMLWEKRTQLMRETWSAIDSDIGHGDMRTMAREVHRMEVRYAQLMKQQERLLRDMESVVSRRETIMIQSESQTRSNHMQTPHNEYHTIQGLQRKILQTKKQSEECGGVIAQLEDRQHYLSSSLREKQTDLSELQNRRAILAQDLTAFQKTKERNLSRLLTLQSQAKHLQDVKQGRYRPVAGEDTVLELEKLKQEKRLKMVSSILQYLTQECPQHHSIFHRLNFTLEEHLHTGL